MSQPLVKKLSESFVPIIGLTRWAFSPSAERYFSHEGASIFALRAKIEAQKKDTYLAAGSPEPDEGQAKASPARAHVSRDNKD
jgi:hypothetical protein